MMCDVLCVINPAPGMHTASPPYSTIGRMQPAGFALDIKMGSVQLLLPPLTGKNRYNHLNVCMTISRLSFIYTEFERQ